MDQFTVVVIIGACTLLFGLIVGWLAGRAGADGHERRELKTQLDKANVELDQYRHKVTEHFTRTAELVNNLTESYREVHQHLANSAESLCDNEQLTEQLQHPLKSGQADNNNADETLKVAVDTQLEAPKDYAPKTDPGAAGTLSESFGLHSNADNPEHDPTKTVDHAKS